MINVAVVGCGYWGKNLVRNFAELKALAAVYDTDHGLGASIAQEYGTACRPFEAILQDASIHGIVIAAPAIHHAALAEQALDAGKHIFVEKPVALTVREAQRLCQLAEQKGRLLMVGHLLQYHPGFLELEAIVHQGRLGKLQYIYSNRLNLGKFREHENILWDLAPHDISMMLSLAQCMPETVLTTGHCHVNTHIADLTTTHFNFPNSLNAHIFLSWLHPYKEHKLIVIGDEGMAVFDDGADWHNKLQLYKHRVLWTEGSPIADRADATLIPLPQQEPLRLECMHFLECIESGQTPRTDGYESLQVIRILEAAQQSMRDRVPVQLEGVACRPAPQAAAQNPLSRKA